MRLKKIGMEQKLTDKQKEYIRALKQDDNEKLLETMKTIRDDGSVELFPALFDLYQRNNDERIQDAFLKIIMDVKDKRAPGIISEELRTRTWTTGLSPLLSSVWQSGLDYGEQISVFLDFVKSSDLNVCMEALTCVEEFFYKESVSNRDEVRQSLKDIALQAEGSHQDLIMIYLENLK